MSKETLDGGAVREIAMLATMGAAATESIQFEGKEVPVLLMKQGESVRAEGVKKFFDEWRERPERREGVAHVVTLDSFIDLTNHHKTHCSALFAAMDRDGKSARMVSVIDYDGATSEANNQRHRVAYEFPFSREWLMLAAGNDKPMAQVDFAEFVEDNIHLFAVADGDELAVEKMFGTVFATPAEMLTLSKGLKISAEATIKEVRDLRSGEVEIQFEEKHRDAAGQPLHVPGLIMFKAPIFDGGEPKRFIARLRYRRAEGRIVWRYVLYRPVDAIRAAVERDAARAQEETALPLFMGAPERMANGQITR